MKGFLYLTLSLVAGACLLSCTGRTADNMTPTGETIEVVIPTQDVEQDSVIVNGQADIL